MLVGLGWIGPVWAHCGGAGNEDRQRLKVEGGRCGNAVAEPGGAGRSGFRRGWCWPAGGAAWPSGLDEGDACARASEQARSAAGHSGVSSTRVAGRAPATEPRAQRRASAQGHSKARATGRRDGAWQRGGFGVPWGPCRCRPCANARVSSCAGF